MTPPDADGIGLISFAFQQFQAGDAAGAQRLWERFFPRLVGLARKTLGRRPQRVADADDAVQKALASFFFDRACQGAFGSASIATTLWALLGVIAAQGASRRGREAAATAAAAVFDEAGLGGLTIAPDSTPSPPPRRPTSISIARTCSPPSTTTAHAAVLRLLGHKNREIAESPCQWSGKWMQAGRRFAAAGKSRTDAAFANRKRTCRETSPFRHVPAEEGCPGSSSHRCAHPPPFFLWPSHVKRMKCATASSHNGPARPGRVWSRCRLSRPADARTAAHGALRARLLVEIEVRRSGERPDAEEYRKRFPTHAAVVAEAFRTAESGIGDMSADCTRSQAASRAKVALQAAPQKIEALGCAQRSARAFAAFGAP
ncbi:MAG: hypothetical protein U0793_15835 [Gemmataceae bacterium]